MGPERSSRQAPTPIFRSPLRPVGKPMRVGVFEGDTVVYSVGRDGRDDKGQRDSRFDTQPGDLIFRTTTNPR